MPVSRCDILIYKSGESECLYLPLSRHFLNLKTKTSGESCHVCATNSIKACYSAPRVLSYVFLPQYQNIEATRRYVRVCLSIPYIKHRDGGIRNLSISWLLPVRSPRLRYQWCVFPLLESLKSSTESRMFCCRSWKNMKGRIWLETSHLCHSTLSKLCRLCTGYSNFSRIWINLLCSAAVFASETRRL